MTILENHADEVVNALPRIGKSGEAAKRLHARLVGCPWRPAPGQSLQDWAAPDTGESLANWFEAAFPNEVTKKLRLIVGESRGAHRREPNEPFHSTEPKLIRAATSDGASGAELLLGLLRHNLAVKSIDFRSQIDEWEETSDEIAQSHLIVIGTGETNIVAAYLHGLAPDLHFGGTGAKFSLDNIRNQVVVNSFGIEHTFNRSDLHIGTVLLLKNPWNPDYRLLWVAGLSGYATAGGCRLIMLGDEVLNPKSINVIGILYGTNQEKNRFSCHAELSRDGLAWQMCQGMLSPPPVSVRTRSGSSAQSDYGWDEYAPLTFIWYGQQHKLDNDNQKKLIDVLLEVYLKDPNCVIDKYELIKMANVENKDIKEYFKHKTIWDNQVILHYVNDNRGVIPRGSYRLKRPE